MKLVILRHADAGDADEFAKTGKSDDQRPLSEKGHEQMKGVTEGLKKLVPAADLLVSSPYVRAVQTAEHVRAAYGKIAQDETETLEPDGSPSEFEAWLKAHGKHEVVVAVGHEPNLGHLASWFMCGSAESRVEMKKAGACLLVFDDRARKGEGTLRWLMGPTQLDAL